MHYKASHITPGLPAFIIGLRRLHALVRPVGIGIEVPDELGGVVEGFVDFALARSIHIAEDRLIDLYGRLVDGIA